MSFEDWRFDIYYAFLFGGRAVEPTVQEMFPALFAVHERPPPILRRRRIEVLG